MTTAGVFQLFYCNRAISILILFQEEIKLFITAIVYNPINMPKHFNWKSLIGMKIEERILTGARVLVGYVHKV